MYLRLCVCLSYCGLGIAQWKGDHSKAYKRWPVHLPDVMRSLLIIWNPHLQRPEIFAHDSLCFGCLGSVWGYCSLSCMLAVIFGRLFLIPLLAYVDDFLGVDVLPLARQAFLIFVRLHVLLGIPLKPEKLEGPNRIMAVLGLEVLLTSSGILCRPSRSRCNKFLAALTPVLSDRWLSPNLARRLGGKAGFLASGLWGRVGRIGIAALWHFVSQDTTQHISIAELVALRFLAALIAFAPPRSINPDTWTTPQRAVAWTDGFWNPITRSGGIGGVLLLLHPDSTVRAAFSFSAPVPDALLHRWYLIKAPRNCIAQVEALAAVVLLTTFTEELRSHSLVLFEDNVGVQSNLIRASARNPLSAEITAAFWWCACLAEIRPWVERVCSRNNVADAPSRFLRGLTDLLGCVSRPPSLPTWVLAGFPALLADIQQVHANTAVVANPPLLPDFIAVSQEEIETMLSHWT
jgi:hypothetical protein